jgi:ubiquinone/menaquinone biosynthesis C-methylase UbiE
LAAIEPQQLDVSQPLPFPDSSFDVVFAELLLHYFPDTIMQQIMTEISRVLKPGGILACMMNSTKDPEYDEAKLDSDGL